MRCTSTAPDLSSLSERVSEIVSTAIFSGTNCLVSSSPGIGTPYWCHIRPMYGALPSRTLLPLPACGERVGVRGPIRWVQNCGAQNRGEAPSPSLATLARPLPACGERLNHSELADSVLQPETWPPLKPLENQRLRCSEVPWVKESGTT